MAVRITVTDPAKGMSVDVDIEPWNTVDELIESVASYWEKELAAYVLKLNAYVLRGETPLGNIQIQEGDIFELVHDPEGG
jgi:hypothetical protein